MSTIKSDSIQPTSTSNNLILRTGVGDVERMRIGPAGGVTFSSAVSMNNGLTASVLDVTGTTKLNGSVYAAANVYATGGTVVMGSAYTHRNRIINGDMRVNQYWTRGACGGNSVAGTIAFRTCDMWYMTRAAGNTFTIQGGITTGGATLSGLMTYLRVATPATTKALVAGDYGLIWTGIESINMGDFLYGTAAAKNTTLSFMVRSNVTGTMGGSIVAHAPTLVPFRNFVFQYTINAANTWEYKTITIPGDIGGTWQSEIGQPCAYVQWNIGSGSNLGNATPNTWQSTASTASGAPSPLFGTGNTQFVSTANATWDITGVQWELGSVATPFEYRPYSVELNMCKRYLEVERGAFQNFPSTGVTTAWMWPSLRHVGADNMFQLSFQTEKRAVPSLAFTFDPAVQGNAIVTFHTSTTGFFGYPRNLATGVATDGTVDSHLTSWIISSEFAPTTT